jgi:hypothetical protein
MKKKLNAYCLALILFVTPVVSACGSETAEMTADDAEILDDIQDDLTEEDREIINEIKEELQEDASVEASSEESIAYTLDFEPTEEILNAKFDEGKFQVGKDMVFQLFTMTFADVNKIISESSESERYSWDDYDQYVPYSEHVLLRIDGDGYLAFTFTNYADHANIRTKIEDCTLTGIEILWNRPDKTIYYAGGINSDGRNVNLDNIENLFDGYNEGHKHDYQPNKWYYQDVAKMVSQAHEYYLSTLSKYGKKNDMGGYSPYNFNYVFDMDFSDGKCKSIKLNVDLNENSYSKLGLNQDDYVMVDSLKSDSESQSDSNIDNNIMGVWGDVEVKEYVDDEYGIHFYLPTTAKITVKEPWYNFDIVNRTYYISGEGFNGEEYLCQTQKAPEGMGGDSIEDELYGEIAKKDGYVYSINFLNPDTQYDFELSDAMIEFISDYRKKILDSAWVE